MSGYTRLKIIPGSDLDKMLRAKGKKVKSVSIDKSKKETKAKEPVVLLPKPVALPKPKPKAKAKDIPIDNMLVPKPGFKPRSKKELEVLGIVKKKPNKGTIQYILDIVPSEIEETLFERIEENYEDPFGRFAIKERNRELKKSYQKLKEIIKSKKLKAKTMEEEKKIWKEVWRDTFD